VKPVERRAPEKIPEDVASKGTLFVETDPVSAEVTMVTGDGDIFYQGILLEPGTHRIRISAMDYKDETKMVLIGAGKVSRIRVQLVSVAPAVPVDEPKRELPKILTGENFRYEGDAVDGRKHGEGTVVLANGDRYTGQWVDDEKHGRGTYSFANGDQYTGEWDNGRFHGTGTYAFKNGGRYTGPWRYDQKHGQGVYYHSNGDRWEGSYINNKRHGKGTFFEADGEAVEEYWENDKLIR
jgi:hypothetical protein